MPARVDVDGAETRTDRHDTVAVSISRKHHGKRRGTATKNGRGTQQLEGAPVRVLDGDACTNVRAGDLGACLQTQQGTQKSARNKNIYYQLISLAIRARKQQHEVNVRARLQ